MAAAAKKQREITGVRWSIESGPVGGGIRCIRMFKIRVLLLLFSTSVVVMNPDAIVT